MSKSVHRALTTILLSLTGISGVLSATDTSTLGLSPTTVAWCGVVLAVSGIIVQAIRQAFDPAP